MRKFKCHKEIMAAEITGITMNADGSGRLYFDFSRDQTMLQQNVTADWIFKHGPKIGGYFVMYNDNYQSFSPKEAFEEGYTEIIEALPVSG